MAVNLFKKVSLEEIEKIIRDAGKYADEGIQTPKGFDFTALERKSLSSREIASKIDHTLLRPDAVSEEIKTLCNEAAEYHFASVCVNPSYVSLCRSMLAGTNVRTGTVIGFPLGAGLTSSKRYEAEEALSSGADELDMVLNIGKLKDGELDYVFFDIYEVVNTAKTQGKLTKVIIETCFLTDEEKIRACLVSLKAGADYVKTSTGFGKGGAAAEDVALMKFIAGNRMKVKASGGIRTREDAEMMIACGADRLGTSSGIKIITESGGK